jgi:NAD(P)-dependent dehydrogenase (short-subunit alcohol dehydrogenase family)
MAMELGKYKIRVNAIARGLTNSDSLLKPFDDYRLKKEGERIVPLRRWGNDTSDLASMVLYLGADVSSFMTGTVIFVDGGQSLVRPQMRSFL